MVSDNRIMGFFLPLFLFHVLILAFFYHFLPVDDAFISFRYARNLADGKGLVYNEGEFVEGYSNFLWVLILSGFYFLGFSPVWVSILLGILSGLCIIIVVPVILDSVYPGAAGNKWIVLLFLAINPMFVFWFASGMESGFFALLVVLLSYTVFNIIDYRTGWGRLAVLLVMVAFTRVEGSIVSIASLVYLYLFLRRGKAVGKNLFYAAVSFTIFYCGFLAFRFFYYGSLLPNTFHAKVVFGLGFFLRGMDYLLAYSGAAFIIPLSAFLTGKKSVLNVKTGYLLMVSCIYFVFFIGVGGDHMPGRLLMIPFIFIFISTYPDLEAVFRDERLKKIFFIGVCLFLLLNYQYFFEWYKIKRIWDYDRKCIGGWLSKNLGEDEQIAAIAAGIIPYYSGLKTIDLCGLNEPVLARQPVLNDSVNWGPGHDKCSLDYAKKHDVSYIYFNDENISAYDESFRAHTIQCPLGEKTLYLKGVKSLA